MVERVVQFSTLPIRFSHEYPFARGRTHLLWPRGFHQYQYVRLGVTTNANTGISIVYHTSGHESSEVVTVTMRACTVCCIVLLVHVTRCLLQVIVLFCSLPCLAEAGI